MAKYWQVFLEKEPGWEADIANQKNCSCVAARENWQGSAHAVKTDRLIIKQAKQPKQPI